MIAACSRHAQYSATAPSFEKWDGSQYPLYSTRFFVRPSVLGWKPVFWVSTGRASGVTRCAIAALKRCSGA
jgi:hypothetical protein